MAVSVCIILNKWHPKLPEVIASYQNCASEILIGLNGGFQLPEGFAEGSKVKVVSLEWEGYGPTKNRLAQQAANDWIISIDSDELASTELQQSLKHAELNNPKVIYTVRMLHFLGEKPMRFGAWGRGKKQFLRIYNRKSTAWDDSDVHEGIMKPAGVELKTLEGAIHHYTAANYAELLSKNRHYAQLAAKKYHKQGKKSGAVSVYSRAAFTFIKEYIFYFGFLDGKEGWLLAKANTWYTFWKYQFLRDLWLSKR